MPKFEFTIDAEYYKQHTPKLTSPGVAILDEEELNFRLSLYKIKGQHITNKWVNDF